MTLRKPLDSDGAHPQLLTAKCVAELLQISTRSLWRLLSAGKLLQPVRLGGSVRWRAAEVTRWINAGCPAMKEWDRPRR